MKTFEGLGLHRVLEKSLHHMDYSKPTPIQAQAIPLALQGRDIMGSAQTGTGKTAAFAIPLVEKLLRDPYGTALVLTPTRELGKQIMGIMHQLLGPKSSIKTAFIIGGESMGKQISQLRARPRLIVGTPGRINDHLERGNLDLDAAHFLVLDETDRMLDMGFTIQLEKIFKYMPNDRQTLMFSATLPKNILKMADKYMNNPERVSVGEVNVIAKNIKQEVVRIEQDKKYQELMTQLHDREGSVIVFVKTKHGADKMAKNLRRDGFTSDALHGDLRQGKRDKVMQNFRKMNFRILIATDIAARGLDVPHIEHVVNYDLPQVAEDFIHRMGRTARAGAEGSAISFVSNQDGRKWAAIERLLNPEAANDRGQDNRGGKKRKPRRNDRSNGKPRRSERGEERGDENRKPRRDERNSDNSKPRRTQRSEAWRDEQRKPHRDERNNERGGERKKSRSQNEFAETKHRDKPSERRSEERSHVSHDPDAPRKRKSNHKPRRNAGGRPDNHMSGKPPAKKTAGKKKFYRGKKKAA